jgi:6-phosphogluconolactonase
MTSALEFRHFTAAALRLSVVILAAILPAAHAAIPSTAPSTQPSACWVYLSSNSVIEVARFDCATGQLSTPIVTSRIPNTTWLAIDPTGRFLYSTATYPNQNQSTDASGATAAFRIDPRTGLLTLLNEQPSLGRDPSHIAVDPTGHAAIVANYYGGNIATLPIGTDGKLGTPVVTQHTGKSIDPVRQIHPFPHSAAFDSTGKVVLVPDLGTDKIVLYNLDPSAAKLTPHDPPFQAVTAGTGPRHFAFDASGRHGYLLTEMGSMLFVYDYDAAAGKLSEKQHISTLSPDYKGSSAGAELVISPNGKFLYTSNRDATGPGNLSTFTIDPDTGLVKFLAWTSTTGKIPRNFNIDPTGHWLLCGNQNSGSVVEFKIDPDTGALALTSVTVPLATSYCIAFLPIQP